MKNLGEDRNKDTDVENVHEEWEGGRVSWDKVRKWHGFIYITKCEIDS